MMTKFDEYMKKTEFYTTDIVNMHSRVQTRDKRGSCFLFSVYKRFFHKSALLTFADPSYCYYDIQ